VEPDPGLPPAQALMASLDAYLSWIEEHADGYRQLVQSAATDPDVHDIVEAVRHRGQVLGLLLGTLHGALASAGAAPALDALGGGAG
jgi:hypothetical protein